MFVHTLLVTQYLLGMDSKEQHRYLFYKINMSRFSKLAKYI